MRCVRCGEADMVTEIVCVAGFDNEPELKNTIDVALKRRGIEGFEGLSGLCEGCWSIANEAIDARARTYLSTRRDLVQQQSEANLGRSLTAAELEDIHKYFDGAEN
jgi:hypothetical protein